MLRVRQPAIKSAVVAKAYYCRRSNFLGNGEVMYPRNAASPPRISVGAVVQISDGAVQTAGVSIVVRPEGGAETAGAGTLSYGATSGIVYYTPTQAETDYTAFVVVAYKTGCIPAEKAVVTSASSTAGHAGTDQSKIANPTSTVNLSGTTIKNATDNASQTSVDTLASYVDTEVAAIKAKTDNLPSDPADASDIDGSFATVNATLATIAGYIDTEVAAIKAKTDNLPIDPADASDIAASFASLTSLVNTLTSYVDTEVAAIKAKTDNLPAQPAAVGDAMTLTVAYDAAKTAASQTSVNTLTTYVDTEVAAIKAKTDNLPVDPADASDIAGSFATVNATLSTITGYIDTEVAAIKAKTDNLPAQPAAVSDIPTANAIASAVGNLQVLLRLDSMIESDGNGQFRFDTIALSMAAGGTGGTDWTANERAAIRAILGVPVSGTVPVDPTSGILDTIRDKTNLITTGAVQSALPVTASGQIESPLIIGDDYLASNGRAFLWTVPLPTGFSIGSCTCRFGVENSGGTGEGFIVTGTVSDAGGGNASLSFDVPRATSSALSQGLYAYSVELVSSGGNEVTRVASDDRRPVLWRKKQT